jgi:hypothetical protein
MGRAPDELVPDSPSAEPPPAEGAPSAIPDDWCRLCWHEHAVWRNEAWMLEHRGPLSECTHHCHDDEGFLPSGS